jgi:hypothetical protein
MTVLAAILDLRSHGLIHRVVVVVAATARFLELIFAANITPPHDLIISHNSHYLAA